jgi:4-hydroxythreonine-4-phosphate dehydrogenase
VVISVGCPAGIGPEVAVSAAARLSRRIPCILVGDRETLMLAADVRRVARTRLVEWDGAGEPPRLSYVAAGPRLGARDRKPGQPTAKSGAAQLAYLAAATDLVVSRGYALATGPVSKEAIAKSPLAAAPDFRGHTEWLEERDGASHSVMCFSSERLVTSLVTTHVPLARVPEELTPEGVCTSTVELAELLRCLGREKPRIAVCSLNPHAGEGELLGGEEKRSIVPGIALAKKQLGKSAEVVGPVGAETAYRKAYGGHYAGVVAMYHDQATIPMKLVAFGEAVNVTMGLSFVRTSVDHGTGYDIAWRGEASDTGMEAAIVLAEALGSGRRSSEGRPTPRAKKSARAERG